MKSLGCGEGSPHLIRREHIYEDVIKLYRDFQRIADEFPFRIAFDDELAVDTGGVARDLFSGFWNVACKKHFDGASGGSLVPAIHPHVDMGIFPILGSIISHGYLACGFLPIECAFPILAATLLGPSIKIEDEILIRCFIDHLSMCDASVLREAIREIKAGSDSFSPKTLEALVSVLGNFSCRQVPTPGKFKAILAIKASISCKTTWCPVCS